MPQHARMYVCLPLFMYAISFVVAAWYVTVCMSACLPVCTYCCMCVHVCMRQYDSHFLCVCMIDCMSICVYACMFGSLHVCMLQYVCMYVCMHVMYVCMYVTVCMCDVYVLVVCMSYIAPLPF